MTLAQLRASLQAKGYGSDSASAQTEALNAAYRRLAGLRRWPWLYQLNTAIDTVVGSATISLSPIADLTHIDAVRLRVNATDASPPLLEYMDLQALRDRAHADPTAGEPQSWSFVPGTLHINPAADKVYELVIEYSRDPLDLVADTDVPVVAATYHDTLVWGAIVDLAYRQRDWEGRAAAQQEWTARVKEQERAYGVKQKQSTLEVAHAAIWDSVG